MKLITEEITFDSQMLLTYERSGHGSYGSGYCKYQEKFNRKIRTLKFLGLILISYVAEWEHIPSHHWISRGTLGYDASNWTSKWANEEGFYTNIVKYKRPWVFGRPDISIY